MLKKIELRYKALQLYTHSGIAGILAVILSYSLGVSKHLGVSKIMLLLPLIALPHFLIDLWKLYQPKSVRYFIIDQIAHLIHLSLLFYYFYNSQNTIIMNINLLYNALTILGAFFVLTAPTGILIGKLIKPFQKELSEKDASQSLPKAGKMIGYLERIFILIFVLLGQYSSIGFLISAKAILRFSDNKKVENPVRMSEYVIIGTLMSFLSATLVGLLAKLLIETI